jgi:ADP-ribose pyrophosphatase YjhB (NUDIX family)
MPHIHTNDGEFDLTVSGYLVHDDKTLLIKHKKLPIWTPPSGHVDLNQSPVDALYMEIREEAGVHESDLELVETHQRPNTFVTSDDAVAIPLPFDLKHHPVTDGHRHINMSYALKSLTNHVEPGPGESNTFKWFTVDELRAFGETNSSIISSAIYAIERVRESNS